MPYISKVKNKTMTDPFVTVSCTFPSKATREEVVNRLRVVSEGWVATGNCVEGATAEVLLEDYLRYLHFQDGCIVISADSDNGLDLTEVAEIASCLAPNFLNGFAVLQTFLEYPGSVEVTSEVLVPGTNTFVELTKLLTLCPVFALQNAVRQHESDELARLAARKNAAVA